MVFKVFLLSAFIYFNSITVIPQDSIQTENTQSDSLKFDQIEKVQTDSVAFYQVEKLKQEIDQLKSENSLNPIYRIIPVYVGILTAIGAILGAFFSYRKYLQERNDEFEKRRQERKNELEQRKWESDIRLEDQFNSIVENLGSDNDSLKASAAVSLLTFLRPEYQQFHQQAYLILLSSLKNDHPQNINRILVKAFEKALRTNIETIQAEYADDPESKENMIELDLTRMNLYRIDLHGLNLEYVDLAFSDLRNANLTDCNLRRARGIQANLSGARLSRSNMTEARFNEAIFEGTQFHDTTLVSATLNKANLKGAEFQQAKLQEAHLNDVEIEGAKFEQANLNNTFLRKIKYKDPNILRSFLRSKDQSWKKANFDTDISEKLNQLSK